MTIIERWFLGLFITSSLVVGIFSMGAHWESKRWQLREDIAKAKSAEAYQNEVEKNAKLSADLAASQAKTNTVFKTITNEVQHIVDRPVYNDCKLDADGLRVWNDASQTASEPADSLKFVNTLSIHPANQDRDATRTFRESYRNRQTVPRMRPY